MGAHEAPHWLLTAFVRCVTALGATAPRDEIEEIGRALMCRWCTDDRHHHDVTHLVAVLERVDELAQETHNPEVVRMAAWYHGAVFEARTVTGMRVMGENMPASAVLARDQLRGLGVPERVAQRVHDLVASLARHDADTTDVDAMVLSDADLGGTLAVDPRRYKAYRTHVREEYSHVTARDYVEARIAVINELLARRAIFTSPLAVPWEQPARQNLSAELVRLQAELATLPPRGDDESTTAMPPEETPPSPQASRFGRASAGMVVPAVTHHQAATIKDAHGRSVPAMVPITRPAAALPEAEESAELVGVPFEDQERHPKNGEPAIVSAMERDPQSFRDVPRRPVPPRASSAPSAPSPARVSPEDDDDPESTGPLFRPLTR